MAKWLGRVAYTLSHPRTLYRRWMLARYRRLYT
jgi:hypothetical protein